MTLRTTVRRCAVRTAILLACLGAAASLHAATTPAEPAHRVAAVAARDVVLVSTRGDNRIHVLAIEDLSPVAVYEAGLGAHEIGVSSDGRWAIGTAYGGPGAGHQPADRRLAVIDLTDGKLARTIDLAPLERPNDVAFIPGTDEALVTVEAPPRVLRVKASTGEVKEFDVKAGANHMHALSPDGKQLYVAHVMPGMLSVVDPGTGAVTSTIDLPAGAEGIAVSPDGERVWVGCNRAEMAVVVDVATKKVVHWLICRGYPLRARVSPDGSVAAFSCPQSGDIAFFDCRDPGKTWRVNVREPGAEPLAPTSIAFSPDGASLLVVAASLKGQQTGGQVVKVDVAKREVAARRTVDGAILDALACMRMSS